MVPLEGVYKMQKLVFVVALLGACSSATAEIQPNFTPAVAVNPKPIVLAQRVCTTRCNPITNQCTTICN